MLLEGGDPSKWKKSKKRINILEKSSDVSFKEVIASINVKSIIIAAGIGSRLDPYTENLNQATIDRWATR